MMADIGRRYLELGRLERKRRDEATSDGKLSRRYRQERSCYEVGGES